MDPGRKLVGRLWAGVCAAAVGVTFERHVLGYESGDITNVGTTISKFPKGSVFLVSRRGSGYQQGDYLIVRNPYDDSKVCVRVAGVPGQYYTTLNGDVYSLYSGQLFTLSDTLDYEEHHKAGGFDSRDYGPYPVNLVLGRVVSIVWPLSEAKLMR